MRLLLQRHDRQSRRAALEESAPGRGANSIGDERALVPMWDVPEHSARHPARVRLDVVGGAPMIELPRREFIKAGGAIIVGFGLGDVLAAQAAPSRGAVAGPPDAQQIDTWLAIHADNS